MSRSRKAAARPPTAAGTSALPSGAESAVCGEPPPRRLIFVLAIAATLIWSLALAAMALLTANPPAISHAQLQRADAVVTARLDKDRPDRIRIERVLAGGLTVDDLVIVHNLPEHSGLESGASFLIPLSHFRRDYVVTTLEGQAAAPLIYRTAPETMAEALRILRESNK